MNQQQIDEIKARCDKATAGPWEQQANAGWRENLDVAPNIAFCQNECDASFIAHSREDVPELLAEVERQQDIISALESDKINDEMNLENLSAEIDGLNVMKKQLKAEVERLTAENAKLQEKQTAKMVDISNDGEKFCPVCNCEVAGYYAQYCEHCGQHLDYPEEE